MIKLVRISAIIKALEVAFDITKTLTHSNLDRLSEQYEKECIEVSNGLSKNHFLISLDVLKQATELNDYFFKHLLLFSDYKFDTELAALSIVSTILEKSD